MQLVAFGLSLKRLEELLIGVCRNTLLLWLLRIFDFWEEQQMAWLDFYEFVVQKSKILLFLSVVSYCLYLKRLDLRKPIGKVVKSFS